MAVTPRKRRRKGSLGELKGALWVSISRCTESLEEISAEAPLPPDDVSRLVAAQTQAALAYMKLCELDEIVAKLTQAQRDVARLHHGNGHRPHVA